MSVAAEIVVVLTLPVAAELLVDVFGAVVEFVSMAMWASIVELLGPAPKVKREPAVEKKTTSLSIYMVK